MGRINWFISGALIGGIQVLNQVYENETLKDRIQKEILMTKRMQDFVSQLSLIH